MDPQLFRILDEYALRNNGEYCITLKDRHGGSTIYHYGMAPVVNMMTRYMPGANVYPPIPSYCVMDPYVLSPPNSQTKPGPILEETYNPAPLRRLDSRVHPSRTFLKPSVISTPPQFNQRQDLPAADKSQATSPSPNRKRSRESQEDLSPSASSRGLANKSLVVMFLSLNQMVARNIAKDLIKIVEPGKKGTYPYTGGDETKPPWWPANVRHIGPHHLLRQERCELLAQMAFILIDDLDAVRNVFSQCDPGDSGEILNHILLALESLGKGENADVFNLYGPSASLESDL